MNDLQSYKCIKTFEMMVSEGGRRMKRGFIVPIFLLFLTPSLIGCNSNNSSSIHGNVTGNPTANEILSKNPNASIFMYSTVIYIAGVDWVDELQLSKDQYITEITKQSDNGKDFVDGTANKLAIGTRIYSVKERNDILIAETENGDIRFYKLVEG